jgi:hypothetical protein
VKKRIPPSITENQKPNQFNTLSTRKGPRFTAQTNSGSKSVILNGELRWRFKAPKEPLRGERFADDRRGSKDLYEGKYGLAIEKKVRHQEGL